MTIKRVYSPKYASALYPYVYAHFYRATYYAGDFRPSVCPSIKRVNCDKKLIRR